MLSEKNAQDWEKAKIFFTSRFSKKDVVDKLPRFTLGYDHRLFSETRPPLTFHSFIHLNGQLYEILPGDSKLDGKIAGQGSFGRVKYIIDEAGKLNTLKIDKYKSATLLKPQGLSTENLISKDVGLFLNVGYRTKRISFYKKRYERRYYRYAIMPDLGETLSDYLRKHQTDLSDEDRLSLAFQACYNVYRLHSGEAAVLSQQSIVHRDIKLDNFCINKEGLLSLTDYGLSEYGPINRRPLNANGTPRYLPDDKTGKGIVSYTLEALDVFALKRSVFYPKNVIINGKTYTFDSSLDVSILNEPLLQAHGLSPYFITGKRDGSYHSPLFLSSACLLAIIHLSHLIPKIENHENMQKAIIVLNYALLLNKESISALYANVKRRLDVAALLPIAHQIKPAKLNHAIHCPTCYTTLTDILQHSPVKRLELIDAFNEAIHTTQVKQEPTNDYANKSEDFIAFLKVMISLLKQVEERTKQSLSPLLSTLDETLNFEGLETAFNDWITALDEASYAYVLILLNRTLLKQKNDDSFIKSLSEDSLKTFKKLIDITHNRLLMSYRAEQSTSLPKDPSPKFESFVSTLLDLLENAANASDKTIMPHPFWIKPEPYWVLSHPALALYETGSDLFKTATEEESILRAFQGFIEKVRDEKLCYYLLSLKNSLIDKLQDPLFTKRLSVEEHRIFKQLANHCNTQYEEETAHLYKPEYFFAP